MSDMRLDSVLTLSCACLDGVLKSYGKCVKSVSKVNGWDLKGIWKVYVMLSKMCLESVL